ncbi:MAG: hypothetical protein ACKO96_34025, partial [Flammeovirgaceae bacterium]
YFISLLTSGRKISETTKTYNYGYVEKIGGPVSSVGITTGGSNYSTSTGVDTYNITGSGSGLKLDISTNNGVIVTATATSGGSGYSIGDVVGIVTSTTLDKNG